MRTLAVVLLLVLAGCGGGSTSEPPAPAKTSAKPAVTTTAPKVAPTGKPAPEALSRFRCKANAKGIWNASGYLSNTAKTKVTYQVTVYVGEATGGDEKARTTQVPTVAGGGSVRFVVKKVPAPKTGGSCHVQVLATAK
jgi:hypothetical protein